MDVYSWIDEPGRFDSIEVWESYLKRMEALPEDALEREPNIEMARQIIKEKRDRAAGCG